MMRASITRVADYIAVTGANGSTSNLLDPDGLNTSFFSFSMALPLLCISLGGILISICFCCYLLWIKRKSHVPAGYRQLKYTPRCKIKNDICPVCLEEFETAEKLAMSLCRHGFHTKCLEQWLNQHNTCPMCKAVVRTRAGERSRLISSDV